MQVLPLRMAFHYMGAAQRTDGGVVLKDLFGPLIEELARRIERVTVVAYDPPPVRTESADLASYVARADRDNIDVCSLGPKGSWRDLPSRRSRIGSVVEEASTQWDVLMLRMVNRRAPLVARCNRCPRVVTITGGYNPDVARATPRPPLLMAKEFARARLMEVSFRRIARSSGLVFANSEMLVDRYARTVPQMELLRHSVRRAHFWHFADDRLRAPEPRLLIAGRLLREKGVFEALGAFRLLRETVMPSAVLDVVGSGPALPELERRVRDAGLGGAVVFHGWIPPGPDLYARFSAADCLLFLSYVESFPNVVWEAMAHSVLVVSTPVGALPKAFRHERELLFVPVADEAATAAAVRRLAGDPSLRRSMLSSARARADESTVEGVAGRLLERIVHRWPELGDPRRER